MNIEIYTRQKSTNFETKKKVEKKRKKQNKSTSSDPRLRSQGVEGWQGLIVYSTWRMCPSNSTTLCFFIIIGTCSSLALTLSLF